MSDVEDTPMKGEGSDKKRPQGPMAPIAKPMASKKLHKKLYKAVKKGGYQASVLSELISMARYPSPAQPAASHRLKFRTVHAAAAAAAKVLKRGVKEVVKALRKGEKG